MTKKRWAIAAFVITVTLSVTAAAQDRPLRRTAELPHYSVQDLGTLGGAYSYAYSMNNEGVVAGGAATAMQDGDPTQAVFQAPQTAVLWEHGHVRNLGTLGGPNSEAGGPNAFGEAALLSETTTMDPHGADFCAFGDHLQCLGAIWKNGKLTALQLPAGANNSAALSLNDRGQVIGYADSDVFDPNCAATAGFRFQAVLWDPKGLAHQLSPLPSDTVAFGFGINKSGQAVGASGTCANATPPFVPAAPHAVLWERDGTAVDLGSLGGEVNVSTAINNRGDVSGTAFTADGSPHAFIWTRETGKMQDLGTVPGFIGFVNPCCNTINDRREIVGFMFDSDFNSRAFYFWKNSMVDLNSLLSARAQKEWVLQAAQSINESGQIAGYGLHDGQVHAFLATPREGRNENDECCERQDP